jgi:hypothetical protein
LLLLTVGLKLAVESGPPSDTGSRKEIEQFFVNRGFETGEQQGDLPFLTARSQECELRVADASLDGRHRILIRQEALPSESVLFVYNGATYPDQPRWRTWSYMKWRRLNALFGRKLPIRPLLGVLAPAECDLSGMPWGEIAERFEE